MSDSGTAQEEPALLDTPVLVPRDYTERPQSVDLGCSLMINVDEESNDTWLESYRFIDTYKTGEKEWLGEGRTSYKIINKLKEIL